MSLFSLVVVEVFTFFISELFKSSVRCCTHATKLSWVSCCHSWYQQHTLFCDELGFALASRAGVFRGARISSLPTKNELPLKRLRGRLGFAPSRDIFFGQMRFCSVLFLLLVKYPVLAVFYLHFLSIFLLLSISVRQWTYEVDELMLLRESLTRQNQITQWGTSHNLKGPILPGLCRRHWNLW